MTLHHTPVLVTEVLELFAPVSGDRLLDATVGLGGHAAAYLERTAPDGRVVGLDADPQALAVARTALASYGERVELIQGRFATLQDSVTGGGMLKQGSKVSPLFNHILFDLGIGSHQLSDAGRGFSFQAGTNLTMHYGPVEWLPPAQVEALNMLERRLGGYPDVRDILIHLTVDEVAEIIRTYGEERYAGRIARVLTDAESLVSAHQVAELIAQAVPPAYRHGRIHPATRTFQALRLAVNRELESLRVALSQAVNLLTPGGLLAVISFHSLEDRIVKHSFRQAAATCVCPPHQPECTCEHTPTLEIITKRPLQAAPAELHQNPRARSAKLRVARKL